MKKTFLAVITAACSLTLCSCGGALLANSQSNTTQSTQTQADLGSVLANAIGIGDVLSSVLGVTTTDIVGTWTYQEPAVLFESDNLLTKAGGQIAAKNLASKLETYYQKVGITKGKMTMTFDKSGNFTQTIGGKQQSGTYTLQNGQVQMTYQSGLSQIVGNTQFDGNNLVIVVDMTRLLSFTQSVSANSNNSSLQGLGSILSSFNGMKAGLKFSK